jgi:hypothetical protein
MRHVPAIQVPYPLSLQQVDTPQPGGPYPELQAPKYATAQSTCPVTVPFDSPLVALIPSSLKIFVTLFVTALYASTRANDFEPISIILPVCINLFFKSIDEIFSCSRTNAATLTTNGTESDVPELITGFPSRVTELIF